MKQLQQEKNQLGQENITNQIAAMQNVGSLQLQIEELNFKNRILNFLFRI
jgi:hypothetical protein